MFSERQIKSAQVIQTKYVSSLSKANVFLLSFSPMSNNLNFPHTTGVYCVDQIDLSYIFYFSVEGEINPYLYEVEVPIVDQEQCKSYYAPDLITDDMMCAGLPEGGKDSCQVRIEIIIKEVLKR